MDEGRRDPPGDGHDAHRRPPRKRESPINPFFEGADPLWGAFAEIMVNIRSEEGKEQMALDFEHLRQIRKRAEWWKKVRQQLTVATIGAALTTGFAALGAWISSRISGH